MNKYHILIMSNFLFLYIWNLYYLKKIHQYNLSNSHLVYLFLHNFLNLPNLMICNMLYFFLLKYNYLCIYCICHLLILNNFWYKRNPLRHQGNNLFGIFCKYFLGILYSYCCRFDTLERGHSLLLNSEWKNRKYIYSRVLLLDYI